MNKETAEAYALFTFFKSTVSLVFDFTFMTPSIQSFKARAIVGSQIITRKWVSFRAISGFCPLFADYQRSYSPSHVFLMCNWLKMLWVYTCPIPTPVVNFKFCRYFTHEKFVNYSVRTTSFAVGISKAIAAFVYFSRPVPASGSFINFVQISSWKHTAIIS